MRVFYCEHTASLDTSWRIGNEIVNLCISGKSRIQRPGLNSVKLRGDIHRSVANIMKNQGNHLPELCTVTIRNQHDNRIRCEVVLTYCHRRSGGGRMVCIGVIAATRTITTGPSAGTYQLSRAVRFTGFAVSTLTLSWYWWSLVAIFSYMAGIVGNP